MRIGDNPQRNKKVDLGGYFHQVIIPVYIPNLETYYKDSFDVFKYSIQSLIKTSHSKTFISVISNGSCDAVNDYISGLYLQNKIHEFTITKAIGKLNSILKGLSGITLPLVTITDADVLFLNNWQKATYDVFEHFPKAGVVSPVPNPSLSYYKTANIFRKYLFSNRIHSCKIKNVDAVLKFAESVGQLEYFKKKYSDNYLTLSCKSFKAVIGAGHFIATYNSAVFDLDFIRNTEFVLGGESENQLLDDKALQANLLRLSTEDNHAYHIGNVLEEWILKAFDKLTVETHNFENPLRFNGINNSFFSKVVNKIFDSHKVKNIILKQIFK